MCSLAAIFSSANVVTMAPKRKSSISFERLKELGKAHLPLPNAKYWLQEDLNVVVTGHHAFMVKVAAETPKLNAMSITNMVKDVFEKHLNSREAVLYGQSLAAAFNHCMVAGGKATTGEKLHPLVLEVYKANPGAVISPMKAEVKTEKIKREMKAEPTASSPVKKAKIELDCFSPSQIQALYAGGSSSSSKLQAFLFL